MITKFWVAWQSSGKLCSNPPNKKFSFCTEHTERSSWLRTIQLEIISSTSSSNCSVVPQLTINFNRKAANSGYLVQARGLWGGNIVILAKWFEPNVFNSNKHSVNVCGYVHRSASNNSLFPLCAVKVLKTKRRETFVLVEPMRNTLKMSH